MRCSLFNGILYYFSKYILQLYSAQITQNRIEQQNTPTNRAVFRTIAAAPGKETRAKCAAVKVLRNIESNATGL